ncbi:hypothetical protein BDZ91DRAFT_338126 [Kalaharituber pfeilii]|nr:hypothetical protein BDZ91DRAFT_338126 [Kalaharituber pfeilii]
MESSLSSGSAGGGSTATASSAPSTRSGTQRLSPTPSTFTGTLASPAQASGNLSLLAVPQQNPSSVSATVTPSKPPGAVAIPRTTSEPRLSADVAKRPRGRPRKVRLSEPALATPIAIQPKPLAFSNAGARAEATAAAAAAVANGGIDTGAGSAVSAHGSPAVIPKKRGRPKKIVNLGPVQPLATPQQIPPQHPASAPPTSSLSSTSHLPAVKDEIAQAEDHIRLGQDSSPASDSISVAATPGPIRTAASVGASEAQTTATPRGPALSLSPHRITLTVHNSHKRKAPAMLEPSGADTGKIPDMGMGENANGDANEVLAVKERLVLGAEVIDDEEQDDGGNGKRYEKRLVSETDGDTTGEERAENEDRRPVDKGNTSTGDMEEEFTEASELQSESQSDSEESEESESESGSTSDSDDGGVSDEDFVLGGKGGGRAANGNGNGSVASGSSVNAAGNVGQGRGSGGPVRGKGGAGSVRAQATGGGPAGVKKGGAGRGGRMEKGQQTLGAFFLKPLVKVGTSGSAGGSSGVKSGGMVNDVGSARGNAPAIEEGEGGDKDGDVEMADTDPGPVQAESEIQTGNGEDKSSAAELVPGQKQEEVA